MTLFEKTAFKKKIALVVNKAHFWVFGLVLQACGGGKHSELSEGITIGFSGDYAPPPSNFDDPKSIDPNFKILEPILVDPYWISTLAMDDGISVTNQILLEYDRSFTFSFPSYAPDYIPVTILGWAPANEMMVAASREIFSKIEDVLDIDIKEVEFPGAFNHFVISQSIQPKI